jgi:hypothetical protein
LFFSDYLSLNVGDPSKGDKPSKPRAPRKQQPKTPQPGIMPPQPITATLIGGEPAAPSADYSPTSAVPSLSMDSTGFLNPKHELDLLDAFDKHESFLDDPLDHYVLDSQKKVRSFCFFLFIFIFSVGFH